MSVITRFFANVILEFPVRNKSYVEQALSIEASGNKIQAEIERKHDTEYNRRVLNHIIGIERWSQSRLQVALGEPFIEEEYNGHRPKRETSWQDLKAQFRETRRESAEIARQLSAHNVPLDTKIKHNQFGDISPRAWLRYIEFHANRESTAIK